MHAPTGDKFWSHAQKRFVNLIFRFFSASIKNRQFNLKSLEILRKVCWMKYFFFQWSNSKFLEIQCRFSFHATSTLFFPYWMLWSRLAKTRAFIREKSRIKWKRGKKSCGVFEFQKYGKFWNVFLQQYNKLKALISEECTVLSS